MERLDIELKKGQNPTWVVTSMDRVIRDQRFSLVAVTCATIVILKAGPRSLARKALMQVLADHLSTHPRLRIRERQGQNPACLRHISSGSWSALPKMAEGACGLISLSSIIPLPPHQ